MILMNILTFSKNKEAMAGNETVQSAMGYFP